MSDSISSMILEGLHESRYYSDDINFRDTPVSNRSREIQKIASDILYKKYFPIFKSLGCEDVGVEVYAHDDDESMVENAIYEVTIYIAFDYKSKINVKEVQSLISKYMKGYSKFSYDKGSNQFYSTYDEYDDIIYILDLLESEGCKIGKLYSVEGASDIEYRYGKQMSEWKGERESDIRAYNRSRM